MGKSKYLKFYTSVLTANKYSYTCVSLLFHCLPKDKKIGEA
jgi:hypothetical protein